MQVPSLNGFVPALQSPPQSVPIRFGQNNVQPNNDEVSLSPDRRSMQAVTQFIEQFSQKLAQTPPTDIKEIKPSKWDFEIGYHIAYSQTFEFKLGRETYRLTKTGGSGGGFQPNDSLEPFSYDLDRVDKKNPFESLDAHPGFTVLRKQDGNFMVTVHSNQGGWNGEKGTLLTEEKRPLLAKVDTLMKKVETSLGSPFSDTPSSQDDLD